MLKSIYVKPLGVQLRSFQAEVDVVAQDIVSGNLLIKSFGNVFKELRFSEEEECWVIKSEQSKCPPFTQESNWRRIVKGMKHETNIRPTVSNKIALSGVVDIGTTETV